MNNEPPIFRQLREMAMEHYWVIFCIVVGLVLLGLVGNFVKPRALKYVLKPSLLTAAEQNFLLCLDSILPSDIRVFAQVRMADIMTVESSQNRSAWWIAMNKITSKHVDFLLCRSADMSPVLGIELDDKTHDREDRKTRDKFLNETFSQVQLPLLRIKTRRTYDAQDIANQINAALQRN